MRVSSGLALGAALMAGALLASSGGAQPASPAAKAATTAAGPSPTLHGELALSLREALAMAIENNLDVQVVRFDPPIAGHEVGSAWGAYDPNFFSDIGFSSDKTPIASELQENSILAEREIDGSAGLRGLVPKLGWQYDISYGGRKLQSTSTIQSLSPEYRANVLAQATLPLLRGFLWGEAWVQVKLSGIGSESALEDFRRQLMEVVQEVELAYWDLVANLLALDVADKSLETARELLAQTEAQYEVGVVSRVEVVEAEAGEGDREFNQVVADNREQNAQDTLINAVLGPNLTAGSLLRVVPTDDPENYAILDVDPEESARKAFEHRPELALAHYFIDQRRIQLKFAKNQRLPQFDLRGTWGLQGLSGRTNSVPDFSGGPRAPIDIGSNYWDTDNDWLTSDQASGWSAGALVSIPLGNRTGRNDVRIADLELRKARTQLLRQEQIIILEVREAIRNLESSLQGIEAAGKGRTASQEQLRAERIRLEHGESTPFNVLQKEEDLVESESQWIVALQAYHNSVTGLDRAQGTILRDRNIIVEDALPLR